MRKYTVGLVDLGERLPLNLVALAKKLNGLQPNFDFDDAGVVTSYALGDPDVDGKWYDIPRLAVLVQDLTNSRYDYVIGVTNCRITHTLEQPPSDDRDYFSRSDLARVAIISVSKSLLKYHSPGKTIVQFAAFLLISEVAIMAAKRNLNHTGNIHCVFNECEDRDLLSGCIESGEICVTCVTEIKKANVPDSTLASIRKILRWCRRNSWKHAASQTMKHPVTGLALGVGIGWFTSLFVGKNYYPLMLALTVLPICVALYLAKRSHA